MRLDRENLLKQFDKDELIEYLHGVIDSEIKKSNEMDSDSISECVDWLIELKEIKVELTEEEVKRRAKAITEKHYKPIKEKKKGKFIFLKISAACITALISVQIITLTAFSINLFDLTKSTFLSLIGVEIQQDNINLSSSWAQRYETLEEFEEAENIKILTPTWLLNGAEIEFINYAYDFANKEVSVVYHNGTSLRIILDSTVSDTDEARIYENDNIIFYVFIESNIIWWEYNGNFYSLTCGFDIIEYTEKIIKNIK